MSTAGLIAVLVVFAAVLCFGLWRRHHSGRMKTHGSDRAVQSLTGEQIGSPLGARATLVQFTSAFCAPCRATRRILGNVADQVDGVTYVEIDAESNLDLVRDLGVLSTPTVFVLDPAGSISKRAAGQPRPADIYAALGLAIDVGEQARDA